MFSYKCGVRLDVKSENIELPVACVQRTLGTMHSADCRDVTPAV